MQHIWAILMKIYIPVKEEQLKSIKGKISNIAALTYYHFTREKIH